MQDEKKSNKSLGSKFSVMVLQGCSNTEVMDAMPCHLVVGRKDRAVHIVRNDSETMDIASRTILRKEK